MSTTIYHYNNIPSDINRAVVIDYAKRHLYAVHDPQNCEVHDPHGIGIIDVTSTPRGVFVNSIAHYQLGLELSDDHRECQVMLRIYKYNEDTPWFPITEDVLQTAIPEWYKRNLLAQDNFFVPFHDWKVGDYIYGICPMDKSNDIRDLIESRKFKCGSLPRLLLIEKIVHMSDDELISLNYLADTDLILNDKGESICDCYYEDTYDMDPQERQIPGLQFIKYSKYWTPVVLLVTPTRWLAANGHMYMRNVYLPLDYLHSYADQVSEADRIEAEREAQRKAEEDARNKAYCDAAQALIDGIDGLKEPTDFYDSRTKINNIKRILKHHYPNVTFSVKCTYKHASDNFTIRWNAGPVSEDVENITKYMHGDNPMSRYTGNSTTYCQHDYL